MAEAKKLGPSATYLNLDGSAKLVTVSGVLFKEGESVNLVDRLGEAGAQPVLQKLAGNRFFKVDGGPDHSASNEALEEGGPPSEAAHNALIAEEARIRRTEGDAAADKYVASVDVKTASVKVAGGKGGGYEPPKENTLEQPAPRRR